MGLPEAVLVISRFRLIGECLVCLSVVQQHQHDDLDSDVLV